MASKLRFEKGRVNRTAKGLNTHNVRVDKNKGRFIHGFKPSYDLLFTSVVRRCPKLNVGLNASSVTMIFDAYSRFLMSPYTV